MIPRNANGRMPNSSRRTPKPKVAANSTKNSKPCDPLDAARKRLGLTPEKMADVPTVTDRLVTGTGSPGAVISILNGDDSDDARAFMHVYLSIPEEMRFKLTLEEIFTAAGLTARRFVEVVTGAMMQQAQDVSNMIVAVAMPTVSRALIKAATEEVPRYNKAGEVVGYYPPDMKAIELFGKMSGMLPTPKGSQTVINMGQFNQSSDKDDDGPASLEPMDDFLMELQSVTRNQLPAPAVTIDAPRNAKAVEYKFAEL